MAASTTPRASNTDRCLPVQRAISRHGRRHTAKSTAALAIRNHATAQDIEVREKQYRERRAEVVKDRANDEE